MGVLPTLFHRLMDGLQFGYLALGAVALGSLLALLVWQAHRRGRTRRVSRAAAKATSARSELLATVRDEIRIPLHGLLALAEMVSDADLESRRVELARTVQTSSESLLTMAKDLTVWSDSECGPEPAEAVPFNVLETMERCSRPFAVRAGSKGLGFKTAFAAGVPPRVTGDPWSLMMVLASLLDNAAKFTEEGVVRLEAEVTQEGSAGSWLRVTISDTGVGMDSETLARLLGTAGVAARPDSGTGGFAIARRLVARMGGTLGAESEPRGGSTFWFRVPVTAVAAAPALTARLSVPRAPAPAPEPLLVRASAPNLRILIVEGDRSNQVAVLWGVRALGYLGEVVSSRKAALDACESSRFDLALVDYDTPALHGLEIAAQLNRIPVVAMTAATSTEDSLSRPVCLFALARILKRRLPPPLHTSEARADRLSLPV